MKKGLMPFNVSIGNYANLLLKFWCFSVIFLFSVFFNPFSAQEVKQQEEQPSQGLIITTGDAVIYSKDAAFNEQISKSKDIQQYSNVVKINDGELKIVGKNSVEKLKKAEPNTIKPEADLLASKKLDKSKKNVDVPKKKIDLHIRSGYTDSQFLASISSGNGSFVPPGNDYQYSKYFLYPSSYSENVSLEFLYFVIYFYKNDNSKLQINISGFSVRPPPGLI